MADNPIKLFLADTGPLITLAAADSLDYLKYPNVPVLIPDAVFYEATHQAGRLGAQNILDWVKENSATIDVPHTQVFTDFLALQELQPDRKRAPDLGERAAAEIIFDQPKNDKSILLCEENRILRALDIAKQDQIIPLSSRDFLSVLEAEGRIQSADKVIELAREKGRNPSRREYLSGHPPELRDSIHNVLSRPRPGPKQTR